MDRIREAVDAMLLDARDRAVDAWSGVVDFMSERAGLGLVLVALAALLLILTLVTIAHRRYRDLPHYRRLSRATRSADSSEDLTSVLFDTLFRVLGVPVAACYLSHDPWGTCRLRASRLNPATPPRRQPDWTPDGTVEARDAPWRERRGALTVCSFPFVIEGRVQAVLRMCVATAREARRLEASRRRLEALLTPLLAHLAARNRIERLEERAREMSAVSDSSQILLSAAIGLEALGQMLIELAVRSTGADGGLLMVDAESDVKRTDLLAAVGLDPSLLQALLAATVSATWGYPPQGTTVLTAGPDRTPMALLRRAGFRALLDVPLAIGKALVGRVALVRRVGDFADNDLHVCALTAARLSFALRNRIYHQAVFGEYREILRSMVATYEATVPYMQGHSGRVTRLATHLARRFGLGEADIDAVRQAGELHDVGMVAVSRQVLAKSDRLTEGEYNLVKFHPAIGGALTAPIRLPVPIAPLVLYHHERFDGLGYPDGLSGTAIPPGARILALAEVFDAMVSPRAYHAALGFEEACRRLRGLAGTQLDPAMVDLFVRSVTPETWPLLPPAPEPRP